MFDTKKLNDLVKKLMGVIPPGTEKLTKNMENNFRQVLTNTFNKMDLVTREEFETQRKLLERTRQKLETLEQQLKELEKSKESEE